MGARPHAWTCEAGGTVTFRWKHPQDLPGLRLVLDSNLSNSKRMACEYPQKSQTHALPAELVRDLNIEVDRGDGDWETVLEIRNNRKRLLELPLRTSARAVRVCLKSTWGEKDPRLFSIDFLPKGQDDTIRFPQGARWKDVVLAADPKDLLPPDTQAQGRGGNHGA